MTEGFGQSESTVLLATFPGLSPSLVLPAKPSPIYDIRLINAEGKECEDGEEGEICIFMLRSIPPVGLFRGYYQTKFMINEALGGECYNLQ